MGWDGYRVRPLVVAAGLVLVVLLRPGVPAERSAATSAREGAVAWAVGFGDVAGDRGSAIALTDEGDVIVAGYVQGELAIGDTKITPRGSSDAFVARIGGDDGEVRWARSFGSRGGDYARAVAVLPGGDVIVAGDFHHELAIGGDTLVSFGHRDTFLARLAAADGAPVWARRFGGRFSDSLTDVAVTATGDIVVGGFFRGAASFGGPLLESAGEADIVIASFGAADGAHRWSQRFGSAGEDRTYALALAGDGGVFVAAYDSHRDRAPRAMRSRVLALDAHGATRWEREIGGADAAHVPWAIAVHPSGDVLVGGGYRGLGHVGGVPSQPVAKWDAYAIRMRGDGGGAVWVRKLGGGASDKVYDLAIGPDGEPIALLQVNGTIDVGDAQSIGAGNRDVLLAGLDAGSGAIAWHRRFGGPGPDVPAAMAVSPRLGIAVTGELSESVSFGGREVDSAGLADAFVVRIQ